MLHMVLADNPAAKADAAAIMFYYYSHVIVFHVNHSNLLIILV